MQSTALRPLDLDTTSATSRTVEVTITWGRGADANVIATKRFARGARITIGEGCDIELPIEKMEIEATEMMPRVAGAFTLAIRGVEDTDEFKQSKWESLVAGAMPTIGAAAVAHALLAAAFAFFLPSMGNADDADVSRDQILAMRQLLTSAAEHDMIPPETEATTGEASKDEASGGARAQGAEGAMGRNDSLKTQGHYAAKGDAKREDATLARERALQDARDFGMIGLLMGAAPSDPNAPVVPWGSVLNGSDHVSASGNMWTGDIGDVFGTGLGLQGSDEGGGGKWNGIGINDIGGLGDSLSNHVGNGVCRDAICSGHGSGKIPGGHVVRGPEMRQPQDFEVGGKLAKEVIQRIVRQNAGRYRMCYEDGLRTNPNLGGRVEVKFVINRDGSVMLAQDGRGSDLPDMKVRQCVVSSFTNISFPEPGNGTVTVTYPLVFVPGEQ